MAIVSPVAGTTTDPVRKSMELLPLGPVVMIDTPGLDDEGEVGSLRVGRALRELNRADIAVLVVDAAAGMADEDRALLKRFEQKGLPHLTVFNKCDLRAIFLRRRRIGRQRPHRRGRGGAQGSARPSR